MEGKRSVEDIKRAMTSGERRSATREQEAIDIIGALANFYGPHQSWENVPDLNELIYRAKRYFERAQSHDVGSGGVNTDFDGDGSPQA